ncbi:hypothetical protein PGT21_007807 [Puccinia graminis f. sp. tritici]|uniref:Uncharacterized protein n=1 Tax=Puccinia graminis f. sp. tritici TaxID=56615 RepID=A0A5B0N033_PUCGR|nr:hypothetical protein PGT21_007807 [Puccinia graminis f. sp. tritici]
MLQQKKSVGEGPGSQTDEVEHPSGPPRNPSGPPGGRFLAFFVGSFVFFVGSSSDRLRTLGTRPGSSERRRITRIRPLNAQRPLEPLQAPPRPRIVVGRPGLTRIVVGRPRETPHAPDRSPRLQKPRDRLLRPPQRSEAPQDAPARP